MCLITIPLIMFSQPGRTIKDIPYTTPIQSERQKLDLYIPESDGPMPCLVWVHGGAWRVGSKDGLPRNVDMLLDHGYIVASIGYRLSGEAIFPAQIFDCKAAIRFLKTNAIDYGIDPEKIAVAGSSAGGHLVSLLGTTAGIPSLEDKNMGSGKVSSRVQAVVDYFGPTDFMIMDELPGICEDPMVHLVPDSPESLLLGCDIRQCPDKVKWANPITYITEDDPPFLILHGTHDCTVTPESSVLLEKALREKGVPVSLHLLPGAGHGGPQFIAPDTRMLVLNFLNNVFE